MEDPAERWRRTLWYGCMIALAGAVLWAGSVMAAGPAT
jgi:hypothetical protein